MSGTLRLAFAGTPTFARAVLESIIETKQHKVQKVFTRPDRPAGRGRKLRQSAVKELALAHHLPVLQPVAATEFDSSTLTDCDIMLVVAYGLLIPAKILSCTRLGCINLHTSLLPRWRGAAPVQRTIEAGDAESGITYIKMDSGLDTGPVIAQFRCPVLETDTGGDLHDRLVQQAAKSINTILDKINRQGIKASPQNDATATYADKINKSETELDWSRPAVELQRKVRAFNPAPVAHATLKGIGMRVWETEVKENTDQHQTVGKILKNASSIDVVTARDILSITRLQPPGKRIMTAKDFLNGHPDFV